jgi:hypothetical protein
MIISKSLVGYILKAASRDRILWSIALFLSAIIGLGFFVGEAAMIEKGNFSAVLSAGGMRIVSVLGVVLFITSYIRRAFENREVEFLLSGSISRTQYLLSHHLAFIILSLSVALMLAVSVFIVSGFHFNMGQLLWVSSMFVELSIVSVMSVFFAMVLRSPSASALGVLGFYALSRLIGQLLGIIAAGTAIEAGRGFSIIMKCMSVLIPRLDLMGQTAWLVYGVDNSVSYVFLFLQFFLFAGLVASASYIDLRNRQF